MDLKLQGQRALMTGSSAGIGLAAATGPYREAASVVINGRSAQRVDAAVTKVTEPGGDGQVSAIVADLFDNKP